MIWSVGHSKSEVEFLKITFGLLYDIRPLSSMHELTYRLERETPQLLLIEFSASVEFESDLRRIRCNCPVIVLSKDESLEAASYCLRAGVADYLLWPVHQNILLAKIKYLLREQNGLSQEWLVGVHFDPIAHTVTLGAHKIELTRTETKLFHTLRDAGALGLDRPEIYTRAWPGVRLSTKALDVHIFNLRKKMRILGLEIRFTYPNHYTMELTKAQTPKPSPISDQFRLRELNHRY